MKRLLPMTAALAVLMIAAVVLTATVGAGGGEPSRSAVKDTAAGGAGAAVAGMCIEGVPDCVDMIVNGDGDVMIGGGTTMGECEFIPDLEGCLALPIDSKPLPVDPGGPSGGGGSTLPSGAYDVSVQFTAEATQADMDLAAEVVSMFEPEAPFLMLEIFPPIGRATLHSNVEGFCESVQAKLNVIPGVASVTCQPAAPVPDAPPDAPVSSTP